MATSPIMTGIPSQAAVEAALGSMILSASGWRAVFAVDADEESASPAVSDSLLVLAALAAALFCETIPEREGEKIVAVGTDTRPTGPVLEQAVIRALCARGATVHRIGVAATPEIIAYANRTPGIAGFFYISASHNPIGHNGFKMGIVPGGVIGSEQAADLIVSFRKRATLPQTIREMVAVLQGAAPFDRSAEDSDRAITERPAWKVASLDRYREFVRETVKGPGPHASELLTSFTAELARRRVRLVGDLNGSARADSVDRTIFTELGCDPRFMNDTPGLIAHQIVPEGVALEPCREALDALAVGSPAHLTDTMLGYVPDNDGDRGNLVFFDADAGQARVIDAQTVFALACVAELAWLEATGALANSERTAIVVNGPTSLRIDRIAELFGVEVVRTEVGEANVLQAADELRRTGYLVRLTGEGSNGGTIIHPALVRDPLNTIFTLLKLLVTPAGPGGRSPFELWARKAGSQHFRPTLAWLVRSLPQFTTTSAYEPRAIMHIGAVSAALLKQRFESLFPASFARQAAHLRHALEVESWEVVNYEGTRVRIGAGNRSGEETGGLKILFRDAQQRGRGFLWMRGSRTEPVFRVMVDVEGNNPSLERRLLDWLRTLVSQAGG